MEAWQYVVILVGGFAMGCLSLYVLAQFAVWILRESRREEDK